jgi:hypothetical protein
MPLLAARSLWEAAATPGSISGTASLTFGQSGTLLGSGRLVGTAGLTFGQTGLLRGSGALTGTTTLTFGQTGNLKGSGRLVGSTAITFAQSGTLRGSGKLAGSIPIIFGQTGLLRGIGALSGATTLVFGQTGNLAGTSAGAISGTCSIRFGQSGTLVSLTEAEKKGGGADERKKRKFVTKIGDRLFVFTNEAEALRSITKPEKIKIAAVKEIAKVYNQEAKIAEMFKQHEYAAIVAKYEQMLRDQDEDDIETLLLSL